MLIIICGPPCTGKSTLGTELQRRLNFTHLDVDALRQQFLPDSDQRLEDRDIAYRKMHWFAEQLLRLGKSVIVNATYNREIHRKELAAMLKTVHSRVGLLQCRVPLETVVSRFKSRPPGHAALDLTEDLVRELWRNFAWSSDGVVVETIEDALAHINPSTADSLEQWVKMK
jgi:uncharacterized protein